MAIKLHVKIWIKHHGHGPWPCTYSLCDQLVIAVSNGMTPMSGVVHHIDGDHSNNDIDNLTVMHYGCHSKHHRIGTCFNHSDETRRKIGDARRGYHHSDETKIKIGQSRRRVSDILCNAGCGNVVKARKRGGKTAKYCSTACARARFQDPNVRSMMGRYNRRRDEAALEEHYVTVDPYARYDIKSAE